MKYSKSKHILVLVTTIPLFFILFFYKSFTRFYYEDPNISNIHDFRGYVIIACILAIVSFCFFNYFKYYKEFSKQNYVEFHKEQYDKQRTGNILYIVVIGLLLGACGYFFPGYIKNNFAGEVEIINESKIWIPIVYTWIILCVIAFINLHWLLPKNRTYPLQYNVAMQEKGK